MDPRRAPEKVFRTHAPNEGLKVGVDPRSSRPAPWGMAPASKESFAMPAGDSCRLDQDQRVLPARPPASQAQPEHAVRCSETSIRASEHAELVAESDILQEEISTGGEGGPEYGD